jgi:spore maturation protein CgeB
VLGDRFNNERYFFGEDHAKRLMLGRIVFQCSQFSEITRRIFEGMACGRMVLTDRLPEATRIQELFVDGEDIVYYDDADDAIEKINYYINNEEERERIAANGKSKVLAEHTVSHRVDALERIIKEVSHDIIGTTS